jgi:hypothetical protein
MKKNVSNAPIRNHHEKKKPGANAMIEANQVKTSPAYNK